MPTLAHAHALVVGIAQYARVPPLPPTRDAQAIAELLADERQGGYLPANVTLRLDGEATRDRLVADLGDLAAKTDADSTVFVSFSGHGARLAAGEDAGEYLLPVDADPSSLEILAATAISGEEVAAALVTIPARKVIVVLDCCHAAGAAHLRGALAPAVQTGLSERYYQMLAGGRGRVVYASSRETETSIQRVGDEFGLFSKHLLGGLRGGVAAEDGLVRAFDLFEYVQPRVTKENPGQHPVFKAEIEENFPIALRLGGEEKAEPRDAEGFAYDAYVSYVDRGPDADWVWETLVPRLEQAELRVAVAGDSGDPGVPMLVNAERGITKAKRTVVVLSEASLADHAADFENVMALTLGMQEGSYRVLPVQIEPIAPERLPLRLSSLTSVNLADPRRGERGLDRLVEALQGPLPRR
jgi:hypothetical protein